MRRLILGLVLVFAFIASSLAGIAPATAQGTTYSDTMDSAATGLLSTQSSDPAITYGYENGQFFVRQSTPSYAGELVSYIGISSLADSSLTVDASIAGSVDGKYVFAGCRDSGDGTGYMFGVAPVTGQMILFRLDVAESVALAQQTSPDLVQTGNAVNRIGIDCIGTTIAGSINGQTVLSTVDATYAWGQSSIGVGASGRQTDGITALFDNLTVTEFVGGVQGSDTPVVNTTPTAAPLRPTVAAPSPTVAVENPVVSPTTGTTDEAWMPITEPWVDPDATLDDAFFVSLVDDPAATDISGTTELQPDEFKLLPAEVSLTEFYAELYYLTPSIPEGGKFSVGFCFWIDADDNCYDVFLEADRDGNAIVGLGYWPADGDYIPLVQTTTVAGFPMDPTPGAENFLGIVVYDGYAILSGNDYDVLALLALPDAALAGMVKAQIGFNDWGVPAGTGPMSVTITELGVWDLSSGMTPTFDALGEETPTPTPTTPSLRPTGMDAPRG